MWLSAHAKRIGGGKQSYAQIATVGHVIKLIMKIMYTSHMMEFNNSKIATFSHVMIQLLFLIL